MGPPPIPGHAASAAPSTHGGAAETSDAGIGPGESTSDPVITPSILIEVNNQVLSVILGR